MRDDNRSIILRHWSSANARDWAAFGTLLDPALRYEVPQTRESIDGAVGYLDMFRTWPGDWHADVKRLVCDTGEAVCVIDFVVGDEVMTGISIFTLAGSRIVKVVDYWPAPYEPPPRMSPFMKRAPP